MIHFLPEQKEFWSFILEIVQTGPTVIAEEVNYIFKIKLKECLFIALFYKHFYFPKIYNIILILYIYFL